MFALVRGGARLRARFSTDAASAAMQLLAKGKISAAWRALDGAEPSAADAASASARALSLARARLQLDPRSGPRRDVASALSTLQPMAGDDAEAEYLVGVAHALGSGGDDLGDVVDGTNVFLGGKAFVPPPVPADEAEEGDSGREAFFKFRRRFRGADKAERVAKEQQVNDEQRRSAGVVEPNPIQALACFRRAAERGSVRAMFAAGRELVRDDAGYDAGMQLLRKAAGAGHGPAFHLLGLVAGAMDDVAECRRQWEAGRALGDAACLYELGRMDGDIELLVAASDEGSVPADYLLAMVHLHGMYGTEVDLAAFRRRILRAADAGHADAAFLAANMAHRGEDGFDVDHKLAVRLLGIAARHGHLDALHALGTMHFRGLGVPRDYERAYQLYSAGAVRMHADCVRSLGAMFLQGLHVRENKDVGMYYLDVARRIDDKANACGGDGKSQSEK